MNSEVLNHKITDSEIGKYETCPVTRIPVKVTESTPALEYKNKIYYFCCKDCPEKFRENPDKYATENGKLFTGEEVNAEMEQQKIAQEMFGLSKNYWMSTINMMSDIQDQNLKVWNNLLEQGLVAQSESKKMLQEWMNRAKSSREEFTRAMEENWKKAEAALSTGQKSNK